MHTFVRVLSSLNIATFTALAVVAVHQWSLRRDRAAKWAALSFGALGVVVVAGLVIPDDPSGIVEGGAQRLQLALFLLFPYLLYRFTKAFRASSPPLEKLVNGLTVTMIAATLMLPGFPEPDEPRPWWFWLYLTGFLLHWTILSTAVAWRLWAAGNGQPGVSRRRMRMLRSRPRRSPSRSSSWSRSRTATACSPRAGSCSRSRAAARFCSASRRPRSSARRGGAANRGGSRRRSRA